MSQTRVLIGLSWMYFSRNWKFGSALSKRRNTFLDCRRTAATQERVTAVLRSIPNEAFADSFQKLYERCQPCVVKDDDYFEGQ
jgi:hypothetical protein